MKHIIKYNGHLCTVLYLLYSSCYYSGSIKKRFMQQQRYTCAKNSSSYCAEFKAHRPSFSPLSSLSLPLPPFHSLCHVRAQLAKTSFHLKRSTV